MSGGSVSGVSRLRETLRIREETRYANRPREIANRSVVVPAIVITGSTRRSSGSSTPMARACGVFVASGLRCPTLPTAWSLLRSPTTPVVPLGDGVRQHAGFTPDLDRPQYRKDWLRSQALTTFRSSFRQIGLTIGVKLHDRHGWTGATGSLRRCRPGICLDRKVVCHVASGLRATRPAGLAATRTKARRQNLLCRTCYFTRESTLRDFLSEQ
jgi:hypothetical protein